MLPSSHHSFIKSHPEKNNKSAGIVFLVMRQKEQRWEFIKETKKVRKHAFDQESDQENTLSTKKEIKKKR